MSITTPSGDVKTQECLAGADIVVQVGDEVTKDEPITTNPNVGGFGQEGTYNDSKLSFGGCNMKQDNMMQQIAACCLQEEKECILQDMNRVYAYCAFAFSCFIAQLSFVLKKMLLLKYQMYRMSFSSYSGWQIILK